MEITAEFLDKYNKPGPRYTSYPPATSFQTTFSNENYTRCLIDSNKEQPENISIYIHIPFCKQRCFFCGCNTTAYENEEKVRKYIDCLLKEMDRIFGHLDKSRKVTQIHWGGGTPNSINYQYIDEVMKKIRSYFTFNSNCEIAIECNPAYLKLKDIDILSRIGFNRISLGIQDFDQNILNALNRKPSKYPVEKIIERVRANNFRGVNVDLIYGLPLQTIESFRTNIGRALQIAPDRIVTFSYAHVPWFNNLQKNLEKYELPTPRQKLTMLIMAFDTLTKNGYESIGMDHFAMPNDDLSIAKNKKRLHRNFQGYCTKETTGQVYAFGASAISQLWGAYIQNVKNVNEYIKRIENYGLAVERGIELSPVEKIIREVINEIMCNGYIDFIELSKYMNTSAEDIKKATLFETGKLKMFEDDGLLEQNDHVIKVNEKGMLVVRNIAMLFDPMLKIENSKFSKTI